MPDAGVAALLTPAAGRSLSVASVCGRCHQRETDASWLQTAGGKEWAAAAIDQIQAGTMPVNDGSKAALAFFADPGPARAALVLELNHVLSPGASRNGP